MVTHYNSKVNNNIKEEIILGKFIILAIIVIFIIYAYLDMERISIKRYSFKTLDNLKIIQLSDLHKKTFGKGNSKLINLIKKENPDVLVFTGDLISRTQTDFTNIENLIKEVCKFTRVYYILGNHELDMNQSTCKVLCNQLQSYGATLLDNESIYISRNTKLWGLTVPIECYHDEKHGYKNLYSYLTSDLQSALQEPNSKDFNILLAHNPFFFDSYALWGADLTLCGHVHGGIVRLPMINGILSPERKLFPKYSGGMYSKDSSNMIVSRGLGKLRLFNPPEISVIELHK